MRRFLIELRHEPDMMGCARFVKVALSCGVHFLTHADWGCHDGEHSAWVIIEAEDKDEARLVLPPQFRPHARVVGLNYFTVDEIDQALARHELP